MFEESLPQQIIVVRLNRGWTLGTQPGIVPSIAGRQIVAKRDLQSGSERANRVEISVLGTGHSGKA